MSEACMRVLTMAGKWLMAMACMLAPIAWAQPAPQARPNITRTVTLPAGTAPAASVSAWAGGRLQFIGTATVLIRYQGFTILTDPNFLHKGEYVHLGYGLRSQRLTEPALQLAQLPPIDLVLLSHLHEDHFDRLVQQQLRRDTLIVTTREAGENLERMGFRRPVSLSTWDALEVRKGDSRLIVTSMPGRHGPPVAAALLPPVMGSMLDFPAQGSQPAYRIYISGDTLVYDDIALMAHRFPGIDLAVLHLGGTRLFKVVKVTMDGNDGVQMLRLIGPRRAVPVHFNDYDVFKSPLDEFRSAADAAGFSPIVSYLRHGETLRFAEPAAK
jgi:L-ascorbate metabolism protein UlaG (beta-lactamase superfamily)